VIYDKEKFFYSVKRSIPILIGYFPVGMAYGILMANAGYQFGWSVIISMFVYTGSLQMLMVSFLVNQIPLMTVAVTALLLNSRHIFYGLSFIEKFREYGIWKYFLIYGLTDENYSLLCSYKETDGVNEKWVHIFSTILLWVYWITFSGIGGLVRYLGNILPVAVMATLVIYCLRAVDLSSWAGFMPQLIAVAVTAGLHFWKGNTLLSVTGGTVCYMVLIRSVF